MIQICTLFKIEQNSDVILHGFSILAKNQLNMKRAMIKTLLLKRIIIWRIGAKWKSTE
jgi:hypothetical protein